MYYRSVVAVSLFHSDVFLDSIHARLNSHYKARRYKKKKHKKIKAYMKSVQKEHKVKKCLLILDLE